MKAPQPLVDTLSSRSILTFLFLSTKNTGLVVAIALGVKIPIEALFAFESTCFVAIVGKNAYETYVGSKTTVSTASVVRTPEF